MRLSVTNQDASESLADTTANKSLAVNEINRTFTETGDKHIRQSSGVHLGALALQVAGDHKHLSRGGGEIPLKGGDDVSVVSIGDGLSGEAMCVSLDRVVLVRTE